jgi:hypothetical protein
MPEAYTFNVLKRSPFDVVWDEFILCPNRYYGNALTPILEKHGWSKNEFQIEYYKRQK